MYKSVKRQIAPHQSEDWFVQRDVAFVPVPAKILDNSAMSSIVTMNTRRKSVLVLASELFLF